RTAFVISCVNLCCSKSKADQALSTISRNDEGDDCRGSASFAVMPNGCDLLVAASLAANVGGPAIAAIKSPRSSIRRATCSRALHPIWVREVSTVIFPRSRFEFALDCRYYIITMMCEFAATKRRAGCLQVFKFSVTLLAWVRNVGVACGVLAVTAFAQ